MGNTCSQINEKINPNPSTSQITPLSITNFIKEYPIGKGGLGHIYKVIHKQTNQIYAMKEMNKASIIKRKCLSNITNELKALKQIQNEQFIINIKYAFHSESALYIITNYYPGGNLRNCMHLYTNGKQFKEHEIKFIIANIVLCLQTLRNKGIVHRDLKPENLLFDNKGYLHLADFGIARIVPYVNDIDTSGTPGYMSPESYFNCKYSKYYQVDYFSLGVICYELVFGKRFYHRLNHQELKEMLLSKSIHVRSKDLPKSISFNNPKLICDFINKLLKRKYHERLGFNDINEIVNHPWLKDMPWEKLKCMQIESPFTKEGEIDNYIPDSRNIWEMTQNVTKYKKLVTKFNKHNSFDKYYFNIDYYIYQKNHTNNNIVCNNDR
jgi:serum/glucocorticoid-regulated kinase 2